MSVALLISSKVAWNAATSFGGSFWMKPTVSLITACMAQEARTTRDACIPSEYIHAKTQEKLAPYLKTRREQKLAYSCVESCKECIL